MDQVLKVTDDDAFLHLSRIIPAHDGKDVRCIVPFRNGFITGSRDRTSKIFFPGQTTGNYIEAQLFRGPEHFVASLCVLNPIGSSNSPAKVFLGSNDSFIYVFSEDEILPLQKLTGHTSTVSCLAANDNKQQILSGSWDTTCILWNGINGEKVSVIFGHQAAVWATAFMGDMLLTASADKTIRSWTQEAQLVQTFIGHDDCVRGIACVNDEFFMTCSNDGTLKRWHINRGLVKSYSCHDSFIYSMAWVEEADADQGKKKIGFISVSEDRTMKVWLKGHLAQTIPLPGSTAWAVTSVSHGQDQCIYDDIAVASSTGMVFVFSRDPSRKASEDDLSIFQALFEADAEAAAKAAAADNQ